ncbi:MAG: hypothetical protein GBAus27B_000171 [Mycoplasmataceae bacterium]|nr:MAG: hypothetical protein GBAus27B_000171 [Mycoplasmataceae bacterium]
MLLQMIKLSMKCKKAFCAIREKTISDQELENTLKFSLYSFFSFQASAYK